MEKKYPIACLLFLMAGTLAYLAAFPQPKPVDQLVGNESNISFSKYEESQKSNSTSIMILGSPHLSQDDGNYSSKSFERLNSELSKYNPDMLVVEYLPTDYPRGKGQDYRPNFSTENYSEKWEINLTEADKIIQAENLSQPCKLGKAYFLNRNYPNAAYQWKYSDCKEIKEDQKINGKLLDHLYSHEMSKIGFEVARDSNISRIENFDYRGEDVKWFIPYEGLNYLKNGRLTALLEFWPIMPKVGTIDRQYDAHEEGKNLIEKLEYSNSKESMKLQYWSYEKELRSIDMNNSGDRQVENYWLRNQKMFKKMKEEINRENPESVLVVVGSGHKYFLDELVYESKYDWKKPRIPDEAN